MGPSSSRSLPAVMTSEVVTVVTPPMAVPTGCRATPEATAVAAPALVETARTTPVAPPSIVAGSSVRYTTGVVTPGAVR
jgi:hypothetical protein